MNKKELLQLLKNNLKIKLTASNEYCDNGFEITAKIIFDGECISESSEYIDFR